MKKVYLVILIGGLILASNCTGWATTVDIARWTFDNGLDPVHDDSGHGQNGTLENGAKWVSIERFAGAIELVGNQSHALIKDDLSQSGMSQLRLEAWIYPTAFNPDSQYGNVIINKWGPGGSYDDSYLLSLELGGRPNFNISNGTSQGTCEVMAPNSVPLNQWTNLIGVYDGSKCYIYLNKVLVAESGPCSGIVVNDTDMPIKIGMGRMDASSNYNEFIGRIDEARIAVPEPCTVLLLGLGGLALLRKRRA